MTNAVQAPIALSSRSLRSWLLAFAVCAITVLPCIAWLDRPLAGYFESHVRHSGLWLWLVRALTATAVVVLLGQLFLLGCGLWRASGHRLAPWTGRMLMCSLALMCGLAAEVIFKTIFGRSSPDPAFVQGRIYEFLLLHGGPHHWSFPSGTAIGATAVLAVLWPSLRRGRAFAILALIVLLAAVVVTNYHWLSDVIAGVFLGSLIGHVTVLLFSPASLNTH